VNQENNPSSINVEAVVRPKCYDPDEEGSEETMLGTGGQSNALWYQFIRVWYK